MKLIKASLRADGKYLVRLLFSNGKTFTKIVSKEQAQEWAQQANQPK